MKDLTDITIILDRSGSMQSVRTDTIGGFNSFLAEQKKVDKPANISLVQFDDVYEVVYSDKDIKTADDLTDATFQPRGSTALYDAIGRTVNAIGKRLSDTSETDRPENVLVVIMTDGHENASKEFTSATVSQMIQHQQDAYQWQFVFVGANQDAVLSARALGINVNNAMSYAANAVGTQEVMRSMSANVASYRTSKVASDLAFSDDDRKKQWDAGLKKTS